MPVSVNLNILLFKTFNFPFSGLSSNNFKDFQKQQAEEASFKTDLKINQPQNRPSKKNQIFLKQKNQNAQIGKARAEPQKSTRQNIKKKQNVNSARNAQKFQNKKKVEKPRSKEKNMSQSPKTKNFNTRSWPKPKNFSPKRVPKRFGRRGENSESNLANQTQGQKSNSCQQGSCQPEQPPQPTQPPQPWEKEDINISKPKGFKKSPRRFGFSCKLIKYL